MNLPTVLKHANNTLTILFAFLGGLLAYADQIQPLVALSPQLAAKWPLVPPAILGLRAILSMIGDLMDDGKLNQSFKPILFIGSLITISVIALDCVT